MKAVGEQLTTHRPSYWEEAIAACAHDFTAFCAFVHGYLPAPPRRAVCPECGGSGEVPEGRRRRRCRECDGQGQVEEPSHHEVIIDRLLYGDRLEMILGPPGVGKSSWGVCLIEWVLGRTPNFRWLVASEVAFGVATTMTTQVGETISSNERYRMVFGDLRDPSGRSEWSTQQIKLRTYVSPKDAPRLHQQASPPPPPGLLVPERNRPKAIPPIEWPRGRRPGLAYPNVKAVGWRSGYTGVRADGIIADDLVSDKVSRSQVLTEQVYQTLHQKMLARLEGSPYGGRIVLFGQRWQPRDLYGLLLSSAVVIEDSNPGRDGLQVLERRQDEEQGGEAA